MNQNEIHKVNKRNKTKVTVIEVVNSVETDLVIDLIIGYYSRLGVQV